jgi:translation initiation factor 2-alpha kinase 4
MHGHAETHAVGCNLGWEQLFTSMAKYNRNFLKSALSKHNTTEEDHRLWNTRRCDVIVSAFENSALGTQAITVLQELWANGIRADLGKRVIGGENLSQQYKNDGASWIVIVKQGAISGERSLKIKGLLTKVDVELKVSELITWLKTEISERDRKSIVAERSLPRLSRHVPMDSFVYDEQQGAMDVRIITSRKGGRKINRQAVIEATQRTASEVSASYLKCPILAVELRDEIIDDIKAIGLQDLEGWKRLAHNVNPNERKYIIQVQEELEALKSEGHRQCWIFGFRTKAGGIFHLQP